MHNLNRPEQPCEGGFSNPTIPNHQHSHFLNVPHSCLVTSSPLLQSSQSFSLVNKYTTSSSCHIAHSTGYILEALSFLLMNLQWWFLSLIEVYIQASWAAWFCIHTRISLMYFKLKVARKVAPRVWSKLIFLSSLILHPNQSLPDISQAEGGKECCHQGVLKCCTSTVAPPRLTHNLPRNEVPERLFQRHSP